MKRPRLLLYIILLTQLTIAGVTRFEANGAQITANQNSSPQAITLLQYLQSLATNQNQRLISGQFLGYAGDLMQSSNYINQVYTNSQHWPGIVEVNYAFPAKGIKLSYQSPNAVAYDYWQKGGLVSVACHFYNPGNMTNWGVGDQWLDIKKLLQPGSLAYTNWFIELDQAAAGLLDLKKRGVTVIWRPFHEMNGNWFWWGNKTTNDFVALWRQMFDYYTQTKGLDNLIWAYAPNMGTNTLQYYPGSNYVDIVGVDAYSVNVTTNSIAGFLPLTALGKPLAFTEYGPGNPANGCYDYRSFLTGMKCHFPGAVLFISWNNNWGLGTNLYVSQVLSDPYIVNRESIPKLSRLTPPLNLMVEPK